MWPRGSFAGVCARGAFELAFQWEESRVTGVNVLSKAGEVCRIRVGRPVTVTASGKPVAVEAMGDGVVSFPTSAGRTYSLR